MYCIHPPTARTTIVQAFISSRLDYCNGLMYGVADDQLRRLQAMQNAAVLLITGTRRQDHITPVLRQLQWLQRVEFKAAVMMFKVLNSRAPPYLSDDFQLVSATSRRQLHGLSTSKHVCYNVPHYTSRRSGFCCCRTATVEQSPRRSDLSIGQFRRARALKTRLFC